ncbi:MAG: diacylglycerol kinase family protein [Geminicoccaceae bacterium]
MPTAQPALTKIGILSNPRSQRNRRGIDDVCAAIGGRTDILHTCVGDHLNVLEVLRDFAGREVGLLVINGGDGTVQRVLTALLEERRFARLPLLAILPRGMANMTAADVGLRGGTGPALQRLLAWAAADEVGGQIQFRQILRVENARGMAPQRGMFFGGAGIYDVIMWTCSKIHPLGLKGEWAHGSALLVLLLRWLLGRLPEGVLQGRELEVIFDDGPAQRSKHLLVLATTLERLVLGSRPFWNVGDQPIRYTSIAHPPDRLVRSAWKVLYGPDRSGLPAEIYTSRGVNRVEFALDTPFTVDGELFEPTPGRPVVVTAAERAAFLRL